MHFFSNLNLDNQMDNYFSLDILPQVFEIIFAKDNSIRGGGVHPIIKLLINNEQKALFSLLPVHSIRRKINPVESKRLH
jgi:hypothetical protein